MLGAGREGCGSERRAELGAGPEGRVEGHEARRSPVLPGAQILPGGGGELGPGEAGLGSGRGWERDGWWRGAGLGAGWGGERDARRRGAGLGAGLGAGPGRDAGRAARLPRPRPAPCPSRGHSCGVGGGRGAEWRGEEEAVRSQVSGRREPVGIRRGGLEVAGPGEATMKPNGEDEEAPAGGPWAECFEAAVQLALRAGQVSVAALLPCPAGSGRAQPQRVRSRRARRRAGRRTPTRNLAESEQNSCRTEGDLPSGLGRAGPARRAAAGPGTAAGACGVGPARPDRERWASGIRGPRVLGRDMVKEVFVFVYCTDRPSPFSIPGAGGGEHLSPVAGAATFGACLTRPLSFGRVECLTVGD